MRERYIGCVGEFVAYSIPEIIVDEADIAFRFEELALAGGVGCDDGAAADAARVVVG
jgi:hypothetical protein